MSHLYFIWSKIKYDIHYKISLKNICTFEKKHESYEFHYKMNSKGHYGFHSFPVVD